MATEVIHEHTAPAGDSSSALGFILGIVLLVVVALFALYYFGALGRTFGGFGGGTPQVNVPSKMDVNVNHTGK